MAPTPFPSYAQGAPTPAPSAPPSPSPTALAALVIPDSAHLGLLLSRFSRDWEVTEYDPLFFYDKYSNETNLAASKNRVPSESASSLDVEEIGWAVFTLRNVVPIFKYRSLDRGIMQDICPDRGAQRSLNCLGPDGRLASYTCPSPGVISYTCGGRTFLPTCLVYEPSRGGFVPTSICDVLTYDSYSTTCRCRLQFEKLSGPATSASADSTTGLLVVASAGRAGLETMSITFTSSVHTTFPTPAPSRQLLLELLLEFTGLEASYVTLAMREALKATVATLLGLDRSCVSVPNISQRLAPSPVPTIPPSPLPSRPPSSRPSPAPSTLPPSCNDDSTEGCQRRLSTTMNGFVAQFMLNVPNVSPIAHPQRLVSICTANASVLLGAVQAQCQIDCSGLTLAARVSDLTPTTEPTLAPAPPSPPPVLGGASPAPPLPTPDLALSAGVAAGVTLLALLTYCVYRARLRKQRKTIGDYSSKMVETRRFTRNHKVRITPAAALTRVPVGSHYPNFHGTSQLRSPRLARVTPWENPAHPAEEKQELMHF